MEEFEFPGSRDRLPGSTENPLANDGNGSASNALRAGGLTDFAFSSFENEPIEWSFLDDDIFVHFLSNSFGEGLRQLDIPFVDNIATQGLEGPPVFPAEPAFGNETTQRSYGVLSNSMIQSMLNRSYSLELDEEASKEVLQHMHFLFTPCRLEKLVKMYFKCWHHHSPLLHPPTFDPESVPLALLVSVVFMGAMYSKDDEELSAAKRLLDLAELYVYSIDGFADELEIRNVFRSPQSSTEPNTGLLAFQNLQAAYLMVVVQYWAGSQVSRRRAMEVRFSQVIRVRDSTHLARRTARGI
jgi:hypothetical protein